MGTSEYPAEILLLVRPTFNATHRTFTYVFCWLTHSYIQGFVLLLTHHCRDLTVGYTLLLFLCLVHVLSSVTYIRTDTHRYYYIDGALSLQ